jgi:hypothetical protein
MDKIDFDVSVFEAPDAPAGRLSCFLFLAVNGTGAGFE